LNPLGSLSLSKGNLVVSAGAAVLEIGLTLLQLLTAKNEKTTKT
jgi:hypothetical protein